MPRLFSSHWLRRLVAVATTLAPVASAQAAEPAAIRYITPQSFAAATVRLADAARTPLARNYPVEVLAAATKDFLGLPLGAIDRVTAMVEPPMGISPQYAVVVESSQPIAFADFRIELTEHTVPGDLLGRPMLESQQDLLPSFCLLDDNTLAVGPRLFLKRLVRGVKSGESRLLAEMRTDNARLNHLHAVFIAEPLKPLIEVGLVAAKQQAEPEAHRFLDGLLLFDRVVGTADLTGERGSSLVAYATSREAADQIELLLADGYGMMRENLLKDDDFGKLRNHPEAAARAWGDYCLRMMDQQALAVGEMREGEDAFVLGRVAPGDSQMLLGSVMVSGIFIALLLPAVQAAREAARRTASTNHMKELVLSLLNYESATGAFPAQAICDPDGKPLLSWRVAVLPYLEEQALYERFHLDEPWDSPNNLPLLDEMPEVFLDPSTPTLAETDGKTHYLAVVGPGAAFTGDAKGTQFQDFTDGTAKSVVLVQVDDANAVEWTKPSDYDVAANAADPVAAIGSLHPGVFLTVFGDGHVESTPLDISAEAFAAGVSIAGGENVDWP
ncbi:hypothetical protein Pla108_20830 [Botrimarina colliarenosi]|uniref:DUF1559 domain-containing protein n=1 Tax=Botrimarina colliarenosi TaxID=2528001 RepID=A0A5C6AE96_9BACT|nr:DUF1559 domain-containing protein [Botrimarina colliarenosi]TWT97929.1 hypothetical protein Pla108_20830 [Botrimarina colliarenosi]